MDGEETSTSTNPLEGDRKNPELLEFAENAIIMQIYTSLAPVINTTLRLLMEKATPGTSVSKLCTLGDALITKKVSSIFSKARDEDGDKLIRGVGFPTCFNINNCTNHFSPADIQDPTVLIEGDFAKISVCAQIDGYSLGGAATVIVGVEDPSTIDSEKYRCYAAAHNAAHIAARLLVDGASPIKISQTIQQIADHYKVKPIDSIATHPTYKDTLEGEKVIWSSTAYGGHKKPVDFPIVKDSIWRVDIGMSTGEGIVHDSGYGGVRTSIYQLDPESGYKLRLGISKKVLSEIRKGFSVFPFAIRSLQTPRWKAGISEMAKHDVIDPFPILFDKKGTTTAHFQCYILITEKGPKLLSGLTDPCNNVVVPDWEPLPAEIMDILSVEIKKKKKKKKKKKAAAAAT